MLTHLSKVWIGRSNDRQVRWNHLLYVRHTFDAETLEDKRNGLHNHRVVLGERRVSDYLHQGCYGNRRVELFNGGGGAHVGKHFARVQVWKLNENVSQHRNFSQLSVAIKWLIFFKTIFNIAKG